MIRLKSLALALSSLLVGSFALPAFAALENAWDYSVQVSASVQASPAAITLRWPQDSNGTPSGYAVHRKLARGTSWSSLATLPGTATSYTDATVVSGTAYEYRVVKTASGYIGTGFIQTGINVPFTDSRGKLVLLVDNTMAAPLASELGRLQRDLVGDGWTVLRHDVSRTATPASVKAIIKAAYDADRANVKSVFIFGHVPVPYSGQFAPDGHSDHVGAWPADVYYADMDGTWTDSTVDFTQSSHRYAFDNARSTNRPGDGKFDQSRMPSAAELEIGRVDLANQPGDDYWGIPATIPNETELLRNYLNRDHKFRHRQMNPPRRALVSDYLGKLGGQAPAASGYRSFAPIVGAENIRNLSREVNGQEGVFINAVAATDYLFVGAYAYASYAALMGMGSSGPGLAAPMHEFISRNVHGTFTLMFGSWHGDWDHPDTVLKAPLMTAHGLVSVWSGRPHWFFHPMALGETVGHVARLTQNNTGHYDIQHNSWSNHVHVALMGDPTLRLFPVVPPSNVRGTVSGGSVALTWTASTDSALIGYHVYRAPSAAGPFTRLTATPVTSTSFTDTNGSTSATYMVRALKLETSASGTYQNPSQGIFWSASGTTTTTPTTSDSTAPTVAITAPISSSTVSGTAVIVSANATDNIAVTGVQFKLDGANLGSEDTQAPFTTTLDATTLTTGAHTVSAVARDAAGNMNTAASVTFNVSGGTSTDATGGTTTSPSSGTTTTGTTTSAPGANDVIWFDDSLPSGAGASSAGGDTWNWISAHPAPISGTRAHQSNLASGLHSHTFSWATQTMKVATGDRVFAYVYLDPANPPTELMLSWGSDNWEHRAYWGANQILYGTNNTPSRHYAGALPPTGQWVRLEVPASAVGLEGHTVTAMSFSLYNGRATWDAAGRTSSTTTATPPPSTSTEETTTPPPTTTSTSTDVAWIDDALPRGASGSASGGDAWNWVNTSPTPYSGTVAHQSNLVSGLHSHTFSWATDTMKVVAGDKLYAYVYLDPANPPTELMLSWGSNNWEHRAYWGANQILYGTNNTPSRHYAGPLPPTGQWVRLEVPAKAVDLEGHTVTAMSFSLFNGRATWDKAGRASATSSSTSTTTTSTSTNTTTTTSTSSTSGTTSPTTSTDTFVWIDDALPAGATGMSSGGDTWNWVTANPTPFSGTKAHQSALASGLHEHYFAWGAGMPVAAGDKLFAYVYLDPANPPSEIMLSWNAGNWEHRAYWGADKIPYGQPGTAGRYYAGPLPPTGQWVRLEVPAKAVGLEGLTATAMCFSTFDGRVTYDKAGK